MASHILLAESDLTLARLLELELIQEGYQVSVVRDGLNGLIKTREFAPQVLILSTLLPGLSGIELCSRLRATGHPVPILLMDNEATPKRQSEMLKLGIDAYVSKPINLEVFLAEVMALLRRTKNDQSKTTLTYSDLNLNHCTRTVYRGSHEICLTAKEFDLLAYLLEYPQQVLSKGQILDAVWGCEYYFDSRSNVVQFYICSLRKKTEYGQRARLIHTIRRVGYILKTASPTIHSVSSARKVVSGQILPFPDTFKSDFKLT